MSFADVACNVSLAVQVGSDRPFVVAVVVAVVVVDVGSGSSATGAADSVDDCVVDGLSVSQR